MRRLVQKREGAAIWVQLAVHADDGQRPVGQREAQHLTRRDASGLKHQYPHALDEAAPAVVTRARAAPGTLNIQPYAEQPAQVRAHALSVVVDLQLGRQLRDVGIQLGCEVERQRPALPGEPELVRSTLV